MLLEYLRGSRSLILHEYTVQIRAEDPELLEPCHDNFLCDMDLENGRLLAAFVLLLSCCRYPLDSEDMARINCSSPQIMPHDHRGLDDARTLCPGP